MRSTARSESRARRILFATCVMRAAMCPARRDPPRHHPAAAGANLQNLARRARRLPRVRPTDEFGVEFPVSGPSSVTTLRSRVPPAMQARAALGAATILSRRLSTETRPSSLRARLLTPRARHPPGNNNRIARATMSSGDPSLCGDVFFLDEFAMRQWDDPKYGGTRIDFDKAEFVRRVHEAHAAGAPLVDGYAPFCKHVFVPNRPGTKVGAIPITPENEHLLRSGYSARSDAELAVLTRWFPADKVDIPDATYLDVILYSREQLVKERSAMAAKEERPPLPDAPWGIISVKGQLEDFECPMTPITMMRNTMIEEGGSGVAIDRVAYAKSVEYHSKHAPIVAADSPNGE